ncbi:SDR family NAD(P)-dependent oxidoreductase [Aminobacter sp. BA135]|uniref:SDR family NAD(P)-dependent oxidoreductase n=1 Tax=Aminobacter sp. BA135 TaxID=537596 RepID=UPI003D7AE0A8
MGLLAWDAIRHLLELNALGTMAVTQAALLGFRAGAAGEIVSVSSAVPPKPLPMSSTYTASKSSR